MSDLSTRNKKSFWSWLTTSSQPTIPDSGEIRQALAEKDRLIALEKKKEDERYERWRLKELARLTKRVPGIVHRISYFLNNREPRNVYEFQMTVCYDYPNNRYAIIREFLKPLQKLLEQQGWYFILSVFDHYEYSDRPNEKYHLRLSYFSNYHTRYRILISPNFFARGQYPSWYQSPSPIFREDQCLICHEQSPTILFDPCRHLIVCDSCWDELTKKEGKNQRPKCPKCRKQISHSDKAPAI